MSVEFDDNSHRLSFRACRGICVLKAKILRRYAPQDDRNVDEHLRYAEDYDIQFIFDDCVPSLGFYTVPLVDIVAIDSDGGLIGSLGQQFDIESDAPICYINKDLECFIVSENVTEFLENVESWKKNLILYDEITFYPSKEKAEKELEFFDLL